MHVDHNFFNIVFHFTLFSLLVYKFIELGRTYFVPYLVKQLHSIEREKIILLEKGELLQATLKRIQASIKQQESSFSSLETKVHIWHQHMKNEREKQKTNAASIEKNMLTRQLQQNKYLANARNMIAVLDDAEYSACNELRRKFEVIDGKKTLGLFVNNLQMSTKHE